MKEHSDWILDPPNDFGPIEKLIAWRGSLLEMPRDDPGIQEELADVEDVLSWRPEYNRKWPKSAPQPAPGRLIPMALISLTANHQPVIDALKLFGASGHACRHAARDDGNRRRHGDIGQPTLPAGRRAGRIALGGTLPQWRMLPEPLDPPRQVMAYGLPTNKKESTIESIPNAGIL